ncbi:homocitrate synthase-related [Anaeramoeba flamelloides]|uniref:Homocitrate synthase-related n=1 Tax=Anaeramoeba flamelloides TaxID=1746091 RepID=A0ABQ8Y3L3_9EUKA|nr:homocitrate synthase-related [Anaeramoeba flamelloides]
MQKYLTIREDFRRDGLAAHFLVNAMMMKHVAKAIPGNVLQVGYPMICEEEFLKCKQMLDDMTDLDIEPSLVGHALKRHIDICAQLIKHHPKASCATFVPISSPMIKQVFRNDSDYDVLQRAIAMVKLYKKSCSFYGNHIDVALVDSTNHKDPNIVRKNVLFTEGLLEAGARRVIICDSQGMSNPTQIEEIFSNLKPFMDHVEFHPHNDNGNGMKNLKKVIAMGCKYAGTAFFNSGERNTMLDPRELLANGIKINFNRKEFDKFLYAYCKRLPYTPQDCTDTVFGNKLIVTGTCYRLLGQNSKIPIKFGFTSDRLIVSKMLNIDHKYVPRELVQFGKKKLLEQNKLVFTKEELIKVFEDYDQNLLKPYQDWV